MSVIRKFVRRMTWTQAAITWAFMFAGGTVGLAQQSAEQQGEAAGTNSTRCYSCWEVIMGSMCGIPGDERVWTPLCLDTLFDEGWHEPWIAPPPGSSGAPRHGWINTFDGFFTREYHLLYAFTDDLADGSDLHLGLFQFQTPLSRRLWLGIDVPFVVALDGDNGIPDEEDFGDMVFTPKVMLQETQDMSLSAGLGIRVRTGEPETGGDLNSLFPHVAFWKDIGCGWSLRGGTGIEIPTDRPVSPDAIWVTNLAIGQTITGHDETPLGDFTYYLAMNLRNDMGAADDHTFLSFTPGIRTHLCDDVYFLAGYEVSVVGGPGDFDQRLIFLIVRGF